METKKFIEKFKKDKCVNLLTELLVSIPNKKYSYRTLKIEIVGGAVVGALLFTASITESARTFTPANSLITRAIRSSFNSRHVKA